MLDVLVLPDSFAGRADGPPAFVCSWSDCGLDATWVHVAGELDIATTPRLERTLGQAQLQARLVVLDLRELVFMASTGVHAIAGAGIRARRVARRLVVLRGPPTVHRIVTLSGSVGGIEIHDLDPLEPPAEVLSRPAGEELTS
jgi:anti-anti-sigma factor